MRGLALFLAGLGVAGAIAGMGMALREASRDPESRWARTHLSLEVLGLAVVLGSLALPLAAAPGGEQRA